MQRRQVQAIDLMKFVCSILVIIVHTHPFYEKLPDVGFVFSNILGRIIIPFFFISSGYFMQKGLKGKSNSYFKKYIHRIIKLYLIWSFICLPAGYLLVNNVIQLKGFEWVIALIAGLFYAGTYYHLWYMAALIFAMIFCYLWLKKFSMKSLLILGGILLMIGCVETYHALFKNTLLENPLHIYFSIFHTTRNGLFFGTLYVALGLYIAQTDLDLQIQHRFIKSVFFFVLLIIEAFTTRIHHWAIDYNMYFMAVPFTFYWFCWLLNTQCPWKLNYKSLREYSTIIYFSHGMYLEYVPWLLNIFGFASWFDHGLFRITSVLTLTLFTSVLIKRYIPILK